MSVVENFNLHYDIAQPVKENYFNPKEYNPNAITHVIFRAYQYSSDIVNSAKYEDFSPNVVDWSYSASVDNESRQSASVTLHVPKDSKMWFMRREHLQYAGYDDELGYFINVGWNPVIYRLMCDFELPDGTKNRVDFGFFIPTDDKYDYDATTSTFTMSLVGCSGSFKSEYGGSLVTSRIGYLETDKEGNQREVGFPLGIHISNNTPITSDFIRQFVEKNNTFFRQNNSEVPVKNIYIDGLDFFDTVKYYEFEEGSSVSDILNSILEDSMQNYTYWIDEKDNLRIQKKSPLLYGDLLINYRDYSRLIISEGTSYTDSDTISYAEVYGKDGNYYGYCDWAMYNFDVIRSKVFNCSELDTDEKCRNRARWECYKGLYGHETFDITLVGIYIAQFQYPSMVVGRSIEYTTMNGDTNVYTIKSIGYSNHEWTLGLSIYRPYYTDEKTDLSSETRNKYMLEKPVIFKHEIDGNKIKLYVKSKDIGISLVKLYMRANFIGESVDTDGTANLEWLNEGAYKVITYTIPEDNQTYLFSVQLYNPQYEMSLLSNTYVVDVGTVDDKYYKTNDGKYIEVIKNHKTELLERAVE